MTIEEQLKKRVETLVGPDRVKEMEEEQLIGIDLLVTTIDALKMPAVTQWLYNEEWENVLVPTRLPKGMSEMLKQMDEARTILSEDGRCEKCKKKADCQLLLRNPSEILLTNLLKFAFSDFIRRRAGL